MTEKPIEWTDQLEGGIMLKGPSLDRFDVEKFKKKYVKCTTSWEETGTSLTSSGRSRKSRNGI